MDFLRNNLANILTLGNLFSGTVGVIQLLAGNYEITAICIVISLVLDFLDGFVARALKANSALGIQLDSLADMVSFGVLPGVTMFMALAPFGNELGSIGLPFEVKYLGLLITLFSCLRLAIFNLDEEQTYYFKGLNTPANTILIFGLYYAFMQNGDFSFLLNNPWLLLILTAVSSLILVSPLRMISMKFKSMQLKDNYPKIALVVGVCIIIPFFGAAGIPLSILFYIFISLLFQKQLR